jgi:hypothetical protein
LRGKKLAFSTKNTISFYFKKLNITLVFEENANTFAGKWQKSPKIMILTSNPRFTGFWGESSWRIWRAIYQENCFKTGEGDEKVSSFFQDMYKMVY